MPDPDRLIGDLRCRDLLPILADFVDGELSVTEVGRVNTHLNGCTACRKFGSEYGAVVGLLRGGLPVSSLPPGVNVRLKQRMEDLWAGEP